MGTMVLENSLNQPGLTLMIGQITPRKFSNRTWNKLWINFTLEKRSIRSIASSIVIEECSMKKVNQQAMEKEKRMKLQLKELFLAKFMDVVSIFRTIYSLYFLAVINNSANQHIFVTEIKNGV